MRDHPSPPPFLRYVPMELAFGTSGLRGLVRDMTDLEVGINVRGFLAYLQERGEMAPGEPVAPARGGVRTPLAPLSLSPLPLAFDAHAGRHQ